MLLGARGRIIVSDQGGQVHVRGPSVAGVGVFNADGASTISNSFKDITTGLEYDTRKSYGLADVAGVRGGHDLSRLGEVNLPVR